MAFGKLEALVTIPTGGWDLELTDDGGGPTTVTLTATKTYYHSAAGNDTVDLAARLKALLDAANGETYTVSVGAGVGGTGKYTISVASGTFAITWTDTALRDILGWTGNIAATASSTSQSHALGLWLPDCPWDGPFGPETAEEGADEDDAVSTQSPDGTVVTTVYNRRVATSLRWDYLTDDKVRTAAEATTNEAWQTFRKECLTGNSAGFSPGGPVRWYPDADTDGTSTEYRAGMNQHPQATKPQQGYSGLYSLEIPRLVKVP